MGKVLEPHVPVTRDGNLKSSVQNMTSKLCIFPFYIYYFFWVSKGAALAPTYPRV